MLFLIVLTILDGVFGIGLFFSGLLILGTSIYQYNNDLLSIWQIVISIVAGAVIADNIGFQLGRRAKRLGRKLPFRQSHVDRFYAIMERLGGWDIVVVVFGRSFAYSRPIAPFLVGFSGTTPIKYLWMSAVSAILWVGAWTLIGFLSVEGFQGILNQVEA
ncbi:membrane protein [Sulfitobacter donghicola DSW-25 = KCTC 12864 = JCM 14565]|uniref:Membrane protein n=1 Tax=Sulfitobacter donghicola DSW-25 = KCTC 12864 = JCM 14565 TaxID=1300350 RepID=A0A073IHK0_9RHOB|nr:membrane protein [Sulfitobacter donghicola DSW-25 = KCTC 12864 = JCM 14565]